MNKWWMWNERKNNNNRTSTNLILIYHLCKKWWKKKTKNNNNVFWALPSNSPCTTVIIYLILQLTYNKIVIAEIITVSTPESNVKPYNNFQKLQKVLKYWIQNYMIIFAQHWRADHEFSKNLPPGFSRYLVAAPYWSSSLSNWRHQILAPQSEKKKINPDCIIGLIREIRNVCSFIIHIRNARLLWLLW